MPTRDGDEPRFSARTTIADDAVPRTPRFPGCRGITEAKLEWFASLYRDTPTLYHEVQAAPFMVTLRGMHPSLVFTAEDLAAVRSPTLFLWGGADSFGDESVGQEMVDLMPDARIDVLPRGGTWSGSMTPIGP